MQTLLDRPPVVCTDLDEATALPRLDRAVAAALSHAYSRGAAVPLALASRLHQFMWAAPTAPLPVCDVFRFDWGPHAGLVAADRVTVSALLGERHSERLPPELRCVLWADALQAASQALEAATRERLTWRPDSVSPQAAAFDPQRAAAFSLIVDGAPQAGRTVGYVQFDEAAALGALLARWPAGAAFPRHPAEGLRLPLSFVLGTAKVALAELRGVRRGDIVGIGDWGSAGAAVRVSARVGGPNGMHLSGTAEGSRITIHQTRNLAMNREPPAATTAPGDDPHGAAAELPLDRLDNLEVDLRFEVGDLSLTLAELRAIRPGHVFELPHALNRSPVRILAHGNVLGKGHLVAVGDQLGVRVSDFAPSEA